MTVHSVSGGRLLADGLRVPFRPTPNLGGACHPRFLVMHFTSGGFAGAVEWLCDPAAKASAHLVISEAGDVVQLAPFDCATWHAGRSEWRGCTAMNANSIGIELANYGELDGGPGRWTFAGRSVPDDRVIVAEHKHGGGRRGWHTYPARQIDAALSVARALEAAFGFEDVVGHDDIAPDRKVDPGPAFDLVSFRAAVLGGSASTAAPSRPAAPSAGVGASRPPLPSHRGSVTAHAVGNHPPRVRARVNVGLEEDPRRSPLPGGHGGADVDAELDRHRRERVPPAEVR